MGICRLEYKLTLPVQLCLHRLIATTFPKPQLWSIPGNQTRKHTHSTLMKSVCKMWMQKQKKKEKKKQVKMWKDWTSHYERDRVSFSGCSRSQEEKWLLSKQRRPDPLEDLWSERQTSDRHGHMSTSNALRLKKGYRSKERICGMCGWWGGSVSYWGIFQMHSDSMWKTTCEANLASPQWSIHHCTKPLQPFKGHIPTGTSMRTTLNQANAGHSKCPQ